MKLMPIVLAAGATLSGAASVRAQQWDSGDPTAPEQYALEIINRARANPVAEGNRLSAANEAADVSLTNHLSPGLPPGSGQAGDITEGLVSPNNIVGARPPLAMNKILLGTARAHNTDMYNNDIFQHNSSGGVDPATRIKNAGYNWQVAGGLVGENIAEAGGSAGGLNATAAQLENLLMIDNGQAGRGHRVNLLSTHAAPWFREVGVAYYHNDVKTPTLWMTDLMTQDFGTIPTNGPFVVGVVYDDANTNSFYDIGEGLSGVTVRVSTAPGVYAVTGTAGGFAFPANTSGSITVEATGGAFGATVISKTLTPPFPGENVKVDFKLSDLTDTDGDGLPDAWEMAHFGNLAQTASGDPDGDGFTNLQEYMAGTDPMDPNSKPASPPPPKKGGGGGGCGLTGLEGLLFAGAAWTGRRIRRRT